MISFFSTYGGGEISTRIFELAPELFGGEDDEILKIDMLVLMKTFVKLTCLIF